MTNIINEFGTFIALLLVLIVFVGFFKKNPFYRLAESLLIGVSAGYFAVIWYFSVIKPAYQSALHGNLLILIPLISGILLFIPSDNKQIYSRIKFIPSALIVAVTLAINIPVYFAAFLREMIRTSIIPLAAFDSYGNLQIDATINSILSIICICSVMLFLVARHRNNNKFTQFSGETGRFFVLVAIGSAFAYTLMSRLILFMGKVDFVKNAIKTIFYR